MSLTLNQLESQLRAAYPIQVETLTVGHWSTSIWRIDRPDEHLSVLVEEARDGEQLQWEPYWAEAWESATDCAAEALATITAEMNVMDLGCGIGIVGAAAASRGARVWLVDNAPPALQFATRNTWRWRERVTAVTADWRFDKLPHKFERIFGADILYDCEQWSWIEKFLRSHLGDGGQVVLGEPARRHSRDFPDWLRDGGWTVTVRAAAGGRLLTASLAGC